MINLLKKGFVFVEASSVLNSSAFAAKESVNGLARWHPAMRPQYVE
jgi:hypothetical protein